MLSSWDSTSDLGCGALKPLMYGYGIAWDHPNTEILSEGDETVIPATDVFQATGEAQVRCGSPSIGFVQSKNLSSSLWKY